jgi:Ca2+-binding RTX toxin-like protein
VEAIQQGLGEITQNLTLNIEGDENGYVTVGDPVVDPDTGEHTWDVTLSAPLNKGHNNDPDITLTVTNSSTNEQVGGDINVNVTTDAAASGGDDYDIVEGHNGQNLLHGGAGNDLIIGLGGDDILFGDAGDDVFSFGARDNGVVLDFDGNDIIQDFVKGEDQVNLEALLDALGAGAADISVTVNGGNTEITVAGATDFMVTLTGITDTLTVGSDPESDIVI